MKGPIYFGGLAVTGQTESSSYHTNKEELEKELLKEWDQEVKNVLKFIKDSKLEMPLMEGILNSSIPAVLIEEYRKTGDAA